ncbi:RNase P and RNase MRP subunit [Rhodotorula toruloides]
MAPAQAASGANPARSAHTASSIRARSRHDPADPQRKTVYKPVLDSPLAVQWPPLPAPVRKAILDELLAFLDSAESGNGKGIAEWRMDEHTRRKNAAKAVKGKGKAKGKGKERADATLTGSEVDLTKDAGASPRETHTSTPRSSSAYAIPTSTTHASSSASTSSATMSDPAPPLLDNLVIGINEVTRALEFRMRWERWELGDDSAAPPASARRRDSAVEADELEKSGRRRRHKSKAEKKGGGKAVPSALPSSDRRLAAPPTLGDHPAYGFVGKAGRQRLAEKEVKPDYLIEGRAEGGWRLLVNSEMRRLRNSPVASSSTRSPSRETRTAASYDPASSALLPTQPSQPTDSTPFILDDTLGSSTPPTVPLIDLIFVCRPDINPPSLVAHLPTMVAAANGIQEALDSVLSASDPAKESMAVEEDGQRQEKRPEMRKVLLVPLDVGAERRLADKLGLRRVAAIGLSTLLPSAASLFALLSSTPSLTTLSAPWLIPHLLHPASSASPAKSLYQPTTIKHLKTSAPLNPRAEVTRRKEEKRKNKEERKERRKKRRVGEAEGEGLYVAED